MAAERLDAATAMLDGRLLAGSAPGWDEVRSAVLAPVRGDPRAFAQRLVADRDARRERFGSVAYLLEPELKEGVGGLRDVHALGWVRTAIGRPLEEAGILREAERRSVDGAEEFLTRVRSALHLETGRGSDRLLAEQQPSIAAAMGFEDEPGLPAVDGLMRSVFEHARQVEHVTASVFDRFLRGTSPPAPLDATPEGILRCVRVERARRARDAGRRARRDVGGGDRRRATVDRTDPDGVPRAPAVRTGGGRRARGPRSHRPARTLRARVGAGPMPPAARPVPPVLGRRAPARDARRRLPGCWRTRATTRPWRSRSGWSRTPTRCCSARSCTTSARPGRGTTSRPGRASPARRSNAGRVRPDRRPRAVHRRGAPAPVGHGDPTRPRRRAVDRRRRRSRRRQDRLAALYLLAIADAEATGPLAWTPWRATLIRELVAKVRRVFDRGEMGSRSPSG